MYSYEDRLRAVRLYIKLGKRVGLTIRQLGYPTENALKAWYREYEKRLDLPAGYVRLPMYSQAQKDDAVEYYLEHGRCIAATIRALGYARDASAPGHLPCTAWPARRVHARAAHPVLAPTESCPKERSTTNWIYVGLDLEKPGRAKIGMTTNGLDTRERSSRNTDYELLRGFKVKHDTDEDTIRAIEKGSRKRLISSSSAEFIPVREKSQSEPHRGGSVPVATRSARAGTSGSADNEHAAPLARRDRAVTATAWLSASQRSPPSCPTARLHRRAAAARPLPGSGAGARPKRCRG